MSTSIQYLSVRPARTSRELQELFKLRYEGYLDSHCASLLEEAPHGFTFEAYDWNALHMGLFQEGHYGSRPLGYMRLVQPGPTPHTHLLNELAERYDYGPDIRERPLPLLENCPQRAIIQAHLDELQQNDLAYVEASRFVFRSDARSSGYTRFMLDATLGSLLFRHRYQAILLACHPRHAAAYYRYGFRQIVDGRENDYNGLAASILSLRESDIRTSVQERLQRMRPSLEQYGGVALHPESKQYSAPFSMLELAA